MRNYAKTSPQFWIGSTGRELRHSGPDAMLVALYLISNPHANMLGLYYLPKLYIAHETGLCIEGAAEGLRRAIEVGFCDYDEASEVVFVHHMARFQISEQLEPKDKRCIGIQREYDVLPDNPFLSKFYDKYADAFHLKDRREPGSPFKAPSMTLRSQEQEQEQQQEQKHEEEQDTGAPGPDGSLQKRTRPFKGRITNPQIPDWMPLENWQGFAELRTRMNAPLTPRAVAIAVKKLDALRAQGHAPAEVLDQSVVNGWRGIFPLKKEGARIGDRNGSGRPNVLDVYERELALLGSN